jgi:Ca2+-binding RTX toxin-like protein
MFRTTTLSAAALLGAALLAPTGATAAAETCQGQAATHVGSPGAQLVGTDGPDVIVTNGAVIFDALAGDDLVCVTGSTTNGTVFVDAGPGDDSVEVVTPGWSTNADLGQGADTFVSTTEASQSVVAGASREEDLEADVVRIAGPRSLVRSGTVGAPNTDIIDLAGGTVYWRGLQAAPSSVTTAPGSALILETNSRAVTLDARQGRMSAADTSLDFSAFTTFDVTATAERGRFTFRGSSLDERLTLRAPMKRDRYVVMGGGDDHYASDSTGRKSSIVRGSGGRDELLVNLPKHRVDVDLDRGRVKAGTGRRASVGRATGFEDLTVGAKKAFVDGTPAGEDIMVVACRARVSADAGKDRVFFDEEIDDEWTPPTCSRWSAYAHGGRGRDQIFGGVGNDRLIGGPGKDVVDGSTGRDACQAEKRRSCEKKI